MKERLKDIMGKVTDFILAGVMAFVIGSNIPKNEDNQEEEQSDLPYHVFLTYKTDDKTDLYESYADVVRSYAKSNYELEEEVINVEDQNLSDVDTNSNLEVQTQENALVESIPETSGDDTIVKSVEPSTSSQAVSVEISDSIDDASQDEEAIEVVEDTEESEVIEEEANEESEVLEEEEPNEALQILSDEGVNLTVIENIASVLDEEVLIHEDIDNVEDLAGYIYDIENDGISNEFKIEFCKKVFNLSNADIYVLYDKFGRMITGHPTIHPKELVKDTLHYIFEENGIEDLKLLLHLDTGMSYEEMERLGSLFLQEYSEGQSGETFRIMMNSLFYRQINDIPQDFKYDFILKNYNFKDMDELHDFAACMMCEAIPGSYFDAYAVTGVPINRTRSYKWTDGIGTDIMEQLKREGQFNVYTSGTYERVYGGKDLNEYPAYQGVIDCLFEGNLLHLCTNFYGNGCVRDDRVQFVDRGNVYFRELFDEYLSPEDTRPIEDFYTNVLGDEGIVLQK